MRACSAATRVSCSRSRTDDGATPQYAISFDGAVFSDALPASGEIKLLYGRFDPLAVQLTASAVLYYALGLWAVAAARVWTAACHAAQDFRSPIVCGIIAVAGVSFLADGMEVKLMGKD